jgi:hypothetical protein
MEKSGTRDKHRDAENGTRDARGKLRLPLTREQTLSRSAHGEGEALTSHVDRRSTPTRFEGLGTLHAETLRDVG